MRGILVVMGKMAWTLSHWRWWGLAMGVVVLSLAGLIVWVESVARMKWAGFERGVSELKDEARRDEIPREPLRTPLDDGNAWTHYLTALKKLEPLHERGTIVEFYVGDPNANRSHIQGVLKEWSSTLAELSRGARCRTLSRPPGDEVPRGQSDYWTPPERNLTQLALCQANLLVETGRNAESLDLLLDLAQFGRDYVVAGGRPTYPDALLILEHALEGIRDHLVSHAWDMEDLRKIAPPLKILDRSFPSWDAMQKEWVVYLGTWLLDENPYTSQTSLGGEIGRDYFRPDWKHAFSMRLYKADAFERGRAALRRPANERGKREILPEDYRANDLEKLIVDSTLSWEDPSLDCRAHVRLLRIATAFLSGTDVPDLADPFGEGLRMEPIPGGIKIWSVGPDGVDHAGTGEWKPAAGKDILLTVPR